MLTSLVPTTPPPKGDSQMRSPADVLAVAQLAMTMPMQLEAFVFPMRPNDQANTVIAITDFDSANDQHMRSCASIFADVCAKTPGVAKLALATTRLNPDPAGDWVDLLDASNLSQMRKRFDAVNIELTCWIIISPEGAWSVDDYREEYDHDVQSA